MDLIFQDHNQEIMVHRPIICRFSMTPHFIRIGKEDNAKTRAQHIMHKNIIRYPCV